MFAVAAVLCSHALAYPGPPRGTENIPNWMADSALVCKGEVVEAAEVTVVSDPRPPHRTATAIVHGIGASRGNGRRAK